MATSLLSISSMTPQVINSAYLGTSEAAIYTVPASTTVKIASAALCNTTGSAVTVYVGVVPNGGTVGASHRVINAYSLAGNDSLSLTPFLGGLMMTAGDFVSGYAGTGTAVTLVLTGTVSS